MPSSLMSVSAYQKIEDMSSTYPDLGVDLVASLEMLGYVVLLLGDRGELLATVNADATH